MKIYRAAIMSMALMALAGCSGTKSERSYDIPEKLCGTLVDRETISELLPAGEKITVQKKTPVPSRQRCQVSVDDEVALKVSQEWWKAGSNVTDVARGVPQLDSATLTDSEDFLQSSTGAAQRARCKSPEHGDQTLFVTFQVYSGEVGDSAAVKKLVTAYTQAVEDSSLCQ
ncbi:hypothetical protein [Streptomyces lienomycini]|uniref:DUF3558 domain-containing protein n=1 Tax=Streptomyces lienomycini TaxID=284035 RepID=A0ABV9WPE5_9ACTN|nr:hypothetical protein [Streptomyces lienomycini]